MKKVLLGVAAVALLGTVACKKDYTCSCEVTQDWDGDPSLEEFYTSASSSAEYDILDAKEDDAKSACEGYNTSATQNTGNGTLTTTTSCTLSEK